MIFYRSECFFKFLSMDSLIVCFSWHKHEVWRQMSHEQPVKLVSVNLAFAMTRKMKVWMTYLVWRWSADLIFVHVLVFRIWNRSRIHLDSNHLNLRWIPYNNLTKRRQPLEWCGEIMNAFIQWMKIFVGSCDTLCDRLDGLSERKSKNK